MRGRAGGGGRGTVIDVVSISGSSTKIRIDYSEINQESNKSVLETEHLPHP